jgi:hypothetical protein
MHFLALLVAITAAARLAYVMLRKHHRRTLQGLARQWRMHYSPRDRFDLADRIAERFPLPGAAEMLVLDLIYGTEGDFYRYIFSAEYTSGVTRAKRRHRRVVTFREPKGRAARGDWSPLVLAPEELTVIEQYRNLKEAIEKAGASSETAAAHPALSPSLEEREGKA